MTAACGHSKEICVLLKCIIRLLLKTVITCLDSHLRYWEKNVQQQAHLLRTISEVAPTFHPHLKINLWFCSFRCLPAALLLYKTTILARHQEAFMLPDQHVDSLPWCFRKIKDWRTVSASLALPFTTFPKRQAYFLLHSNMFSQGLSCCHVLI